MSQTASLTVAQPTFAEVALSRRSVRSYDSEVKIPREELSELLSEAMKAPSGANLQPTRFLIIDSAEEKERLLPIANNQRQVVEASAVVVVLGDLQYYENTATIYNRAFDAGYLDENTRDYFINRVGTAVAGMPRDYLLKGIYVDAGLISMQLMLAAKARGYDTVPMAGFQADKLIEAYGISERYVPVILIPVGKAAKEGHPTVRLNVDETTFWNTMPA